MAVISLVALGNGVQQLITRQFEAQGSNLVFMLPVAIDSNGGAARSGAFNSAGRPSFVGTLTENDVAALRDRNRVPDALVVVPTIRVNAKAYAGTLKTQTSVRGTSYDYPLLQAQTLIYGNWWEESAISRRLGSRCWGIWPIASSSLVEAIRLEAIFGSKRPSSKSWRRRAAVDGGLAGATMTLSACPLKRPAIVFNRHATPRASGWPVLC
jgi:hypothetical protein